MEKLQEIFKPVGELLTEKALKEKDLMVKPVEIKAEESYGIDQGEVTFSIGAQAALTAQLFNDENDVDENEFISAGPDSLISFKPATQAYLKYQAAVLAKANAATSLENIGFEFESSGGVKAAYYKSHANTESIREAFLADVTSFLTIFKWQDVQKLAINDALSFNIDGTLTAAVSVSWSNVFAQGLSVLASSLPQPLTLDVKLGVSLAANFNVTITDQFSYFIKRTKTDRLLVSIAKIKNSQATGGVGAKIGVAFAKPQEVEEQLNVITDELMKAIVKKGTGPVEKAIEAVKKKTATAAQNEIVKEVFDRLGLSDKATEAIDALKERWEKLREDLRGQIKKIAEVNAELSFGYEYKRIKEGKELLAVILPDAALKSHHSKLLRFKLSDLVDALGKNKVTDAELISYLNQKTLTVEHSWGFGLSLMGKEVLRGKDFKTEKDTIRFDIRKHRQVELQRARGYAWKLGKGKGKWLTEMNASMKSFSAGKEPLFSEVDLSWYLNMVIEDGRVKEKELREYFDMGVLWGSIQAHDVDALVEKYFPLLGKKAASFEAKLIFSETATKTILTQAGRHGLENVNQELMARSLAAAMGYLDEFALRRFVQAREDAYAPLWLDYLKNPKQETRNLALKAFEHLRKQPHADALPQFEKTGGHNNQANWFADVVFTNPKTNDDLVSCLSGITNLGNLIGANGPLADNVDKNYRKINAFLSQSFYVRALGSFLNRYAVANPLLQKEVSRVFTITYEEEGERQVVNLAVV